MLVNVNIDLLRTFVTIVDVKSFTRAGEMLFRTQSTISLQIKRLEAIAQADLLRRDNRTVELTAAGKIVYDYARKILALHDEMRVNMGERKRAKEVIRMGIPDNYAHTLLAGILQTFRELSRKAEIAVTSDNSRVLSTMVRDGKLDLAVVTGDEESDSCPRLRDEKLKWVCDRGRTAEIRDPLPLALFNDGCIFRERAIRALNVNKRRWEIAHSSNSFNTVKAALHGLGAISVLAESSVSPDLLILDEKSDLPDLGTVTLRMMMSTIRKSAICDLLTQTIQTVLGKGGSGGVRRSDTPASLNNLAEKRGSAPLQKSAPALQPAMV
jgi:DNA-binding transcriptional LysR family regulator